MGNKIGIISTAIAGLIVIAFTLAMFFLMDFERTAVHWWAFGFLIFSEVALFSGLVCMRFLSSQFSTIFIRSGLSVTLFAYFLVTLISIAFTNSFVDMLNAFILMELAIIAFFSIIIISLLVFSQKIRFDDNETRKAGNLMNVCEQQVHSLMIDSKNKDYTEQLNSVYENIKYSDKIGSSSVDVKIYETLTKLKEILSSEETQEEAVIPVFSELSSLVNLRKIEIGGAKRGGF